MKVVLYYIPNNCVVNLKIFVDDIVSHASNQFPLSIGMIAFELIGQKISSLSDNLDVFYYGIVHHVIRDKVIKAFS